MMISHAPRQALAAPPCFVGAKGLALEGLSGQWEVIPVAIGSGSVGMVGPATRPGSPHAAETDGALLGRLRAAANGPRIRRRMGETVANPWHCQPTHSYTCNDQRGGP